MIHIKRIDEMAVRYADIVDNRLSAEKSNNLIRLKNFKKDAQKVLKRFYQSKQDIIDSIDTKNHIEEKGALSRLRGNYFPDNDETANKPVFFRKDRMGLNGIIYYNHYNTAFKCFQDCFYFSNGILYITGALRCDGKNREPMMTAGDAFEKAFLKDGIIYMPAGDYWGAGEQIPNTNDEAYYKIGLGSYYYKMLLDFTNQINDFTIDFFNDVQSL